MNPVAIICDSRNNTLTLEGYFKLLYATFLSNSRSGFWVNYFYEPFFNLNHVDIYQLNSSVIGRFWTFHSNDVANFKTPA